MSLHIVTVTGSDGADLHWYFEEHPHFLRAVTLAKAHGIWRADNDGNPDIITDLDEFKNWLDGTYPQIKPTTDPLTTAYLAIGAVHVLDKNRHTDLSDWDGELGFIAEVIQHADALDQAGYAAGEAIDHIVWCYEIAEQFGERLATMLLNHIVFNPAEEIARIIQEAKDTR